MSLFGFGNKDKAEDQSNIMQGLRPGSDEERKAYETFKSDQAAAKAAEDAKNAEINKAMAERIEAKAKLGELVVGNGAVEAIKAEVTGEHTAIPVEAPDTAPQPIEVTNTPEKPQQ